MRINTNISSMTAQENAANVNKNLSSSLEKLSSGLRINKAADDASGMAIADKLRTQASSLGQSISNANSGNALVQIADKAMAEQSNILDIVKTKLIQAATSTTSDEGREAIRKDVTKLLDQLDAISEQTNYNGITLLNTKDKEFSFQVGESADFDISMNTAYRSHTAGLGGGATEYTAGEVNEIGQGEGVQVKDTSAAVVIKKDTRDASTGEAYFSVSGSNITNITSSGSSKFSVEDSKTKDMLLAAVDHTALNYNSATDVFSLNGSMDFTADGGITLADLNFDSTAGGLTDSDGTLSLTAKSGLVNVQNIGASTALESANGNVDVAVTASTGLTGGDLLSALKSLDTDELTAAVANRFMTAVDEALNQLNIVRSDFGSTQNQLDSFIRNAMTTQTNIKAAESVIRDVDYAAESANFNKQNIIAQAGTYAMSQANAIQQNVMRLLQ
jgi:flagellin